ncbi:hypothetical protein AAG906_012597 [Vitis piasezkii]
MAALLHFEEKVHTRHLARADSIPLLFPRLLCHVLAHMGFPHCSSSAAIVESFSLTNGLRYGSPSLRPLRILHTKMRQASSDAPPIVPPTSSRPLLSLGSSIDQQTLILREIQEDLGLVPPAPPVAVPSTVAAEDPSYPPEEPTT